MTWPELLKELSAPFPLAAIQWRAGSTTRDKKRAQALPYAEPRIYEDRLNTLCPGEWSVTFKPWGDNRLICELTIHDVTRSSTGESEGGFAPGTSAEAQAFKRACSKFGLGRYLYDLPSPWVAYDAENKRLLETPQLSAPPQPATLNRERAEAIMARGCEVLFLPPYSPDLNPIELAFSKIKAHVRRLEARTRVALDDAIAAALKTISLQDVIGWFGHAGYGHHIL